MPVTYTNRKGTIYYLYRSYTKTGKPRYDFARDIKGEPVDKMPEGYKISEHGGQRAQKGPETRTVSPTAGGVNGT